MLSVELTDSYKAKLDEITPNFEENLRRGFNNEGVRMQKRHRRNIPFDNVAYSQNEIYMFFRNISLTSHPEFRVKRFEVDLTNATVYLHFTMGQLCFEADVQTVNKTLFKDLSMVSNTNILMNVIGLVGEGRAGIFPVQDSFVPKNYDIEFDYTVVELEEYDSSTNINVQSTTFNKTEFSPFTLILPELRQKLIYLLNLQLGGVIVEYSVNELLLDETDEIREYKEYLQKRVFQANSVIDYLVNSAKLKKLFDEFWMSTEFMLSYKQDMSSTRATLFAKGAILGINSITRPSDWSLYQDNEGRIAYGYLKIKDYKFAYDYHTDYLGAQITGKITATIYENKFKVKIEHTRKPGCRNVLSIEISDLSDIEIDISGLGSLSWLYSNIRSIVTGHIREDTRTKVIEFMKRQLSKAYDEDEFQMF